jgi:hypothetical protein
MPFAFNGMNLKIQIMFHFITSIMSTKAHLVKMERVKNLKDQLERSRMKAKGN